MVEINEKLLDSWSLVHVTVGYLFGKKTNVGPFQFMALNLGYEIFEAWLKPRFDIFNIPFGRGTVLESKENSFVDFFITEAGYIAGFMAKQPKEEKTN